MDIEKIFGYGQNIKLLKFFLENPDSYYRVTNLYDETGISRPTIYHLLHWFIRENIIIKQGYNYSLNHSNKICRLLRHIVLED